MFVAHDLGTHTTGLRPALLFTKNPHNELVPLINGAVHVRNAHVRIAQRRGVLGQEIEFQPVNVRPTHVVVVRSFVKHPRTRHD